MRPLEGIRVVDLSTYVAAPSCGRVLADWGAEVIKVEAPKGDVNRVQGRMQGIPIYEDGNPTFDNENAGKRFLSLDLKQEEGMAVMLRLLATADVFLSNVRPRALAKLGLDYPTLSEKFPRLIYADILAYGDKGPDKDRPGFDYTTFYARSGFMVDMAPKGGYPIITCPGFGDHMAGAILAGGISAALYRRTISGKGDKVDVGLMQLGMFAFSAGVLSAQNGRRWPRSHFDANSPSSNAYQCADGEWLYLAATEWDRQWPILCEKVFHRPDLLADERYRVRVKLDPYIPELVAIFDEIFKQQPRAYWLRVLSENDIAHEAIMHFKDVPADVQARANNYVFDYTYPNGETATFSHDPVTFANSEKPAFHHAGPLGADTGAILAELGYSQEEIAALTAQKAVVQG